MFAVSKNPSCYLNDSYTQGLKEKITSSLFALCKLSSARLIILLSGKNEFISNSLIFSMGNSYGIIKIPYLTSKETAALFIDFPFGRRVGGGGTCCYMRIFLCLVADCSRTTEEMR